MGRSRTVLSQNGSGGIVVDTSNGQVLATTQPAGSSTICDNSQCHNQPTPFLSTVPAPSSS
jgi:hypothetical protein